MLHANTVQYRLRRVEELRRVKVRTTAGLLELQLALLIGMLVAREIPQLEPYAARIASAVVDSGVVGHWGWCRWIRRALMMCGGS